MKLLEKLKESDFFLTKKGEYVNPVELHAFGLGLFHGAYFQRKEYKESVEWAKDNHEDVKRQTHYYELGYFISNRSKWVAAAIPLGGWLL